MKIDFEEMAIKILGVTTVVMVFGLFLMLSFLMFAVIGSEIFKFVSGLF
jgi:hypothetical protein